jgi:hypothetical protein
MKGIGIGESGERLLCNQPLLLVQQKSEKNTHIVTYTPLSIFIFKLIRYIKTKVVEARLKSLQNENQKTEYLLSLTLPWTIVTKLKEVGTGNFDLIAERFTNSEL